MPVYFAYVKEVGRVKIGFSSDVMRRLSNLKTENPYPPTLLRAFEGDRKVESLLHKRFAEFRLHGDWFIFNEVMMEDLGLDPHIPPERAQRGLETVGGLGGKWSVERRAKASETHRSLHNNPSYIAIKKARHRAVSSALGAA